MKRFGLLVMTAALVVLFGSEVLAASGGGPDCSKAGEDYGVIQGNFREEWYCYQERGESYLAGECFDYAISDFERAIALRTALDRAAEEPGCDRRRSRTYGMHFMDWFGHRNRGIALFELGRLDESIEELEMSLRCTESNQAQFYLDQARQARLKQQGGDLQTPVIKSIHLTKSKPQVDYVKNDTPGPAEGFDRFAAAPYYFTDDEIGRLTQGMSRRQIRQRGLTPGWGSQVVSWKAADEITNQYVAQNELFLVVESEDDQGVQTVAAGEVVSPYTFAQKQRADVFMLALDRPEAESGTDVTELETADLFTVALTESDGKAGVTVTVTDLVDKRAEQQVALVIDQLGPQINLEKVVESGPDRVQIEGHWSDPAGIQSFSIGGVTPDKVGDGGFRVTAPLGPDKRVRFEAVDQAGNSTAGVIVVGPRGRGTKLTLPQQPQWSKLVPEKLYRFAALDLLAPPVWPLGPGRASDPWKLDLRPRVYDAVIDRPVYLAGDVEMYWNELQNVTGLADQPPEITLKTRPQVVYSNEIYIEGSVVGKSAAVKQLLINGKNVLKGTPQNAFFNQIVYLRPGKNMISIKAVDEKGLVTEEQLPVRRVVPKVDTVSERLGVSMLPFFLVEPVKEIGDVAYDNLATALIQQRRFNYVDRSQVEAAVREMNLSGSGLVDPATAVGAGSRTQSEAIIIGVVRETETSIEIKAQVVDVQTARIMVTRDAFHQDKSLKNLSFITRGLATKIKNDFPVVQGEISNAGGDMTVNLGSKNRMLPGMKVVIFQVAPQFDAAGNPVGVDTKKIGSGAVSDVAAASSVVRMTQTDEAPKDKDLVITK